MRTCRFIRLWAITSGVVTSCAAAEVVAFNRYLYTRDNKIDGWMEPKHEDEEEVEREKNGCLKCSKQVTSSAGVISLTGSLPHHAKLDQF